MQYMRGVRLLPVKDPAVLERPMTLMAADVVPPAGISGSGPVVLIDHSGDNALVALRFRLKDVAMLAAETPFKAGGKSYRAGTFILPSANHKMLSSLLAELGIAGEATTAVPKVATHEMVAPRIGYMHSWLYTQDEG